MLWIVVEEEVDKDWMMIRMVGGALCSMPQSLPDAHHQSAVQ